MGHSNSVSGSQRKNLLVFRFISKMRTRASDGNLEPQLAFSRCIRAIFTYQGLVWSMTHWKSVAINIRKEYGSSRSTFKSGVSSLKTLIFATEVATSSLRKIAIRTRKVTLWPLWSCKDRWPRSFDSLSGIHLNSHKLLSTKYATKVLVTAERVQR